MQCSSVKLLSWHGIYLGYSYLYLRVLRLCRVRYEVGVLVITCTYMYHWRRISTCPWQEIPYPSPMISVQADLRQPKKQRSLKRRTENPRSRKKKIPFLQAWLSCLLFAFDRIQWDVSVLSQRGPLWAGLGDAETSHAERQSARPNKRSCHPGKP